jgi:hypothetical protein
LWKHLSKLSKTYRTYTKSEEGAYEIVSAVINESLADNEIDEDRSSLLWSILKTDLDMRDKITGVYGEFDFEMIELLGGSQVLLSHTQR